MLTDVRDNYARQRYRTVQLVADEFWRRWVQEYPRTLYPRKKWHKRRENVSLNDIVLVNDHTLLRGVWPLSRVIKLYPNARGVTRVVDLKTASGIFKRPVTKFCVIVKGIETVTKPLLQNKQAKSSTLDAPVSSSRTKLNSCQNENFE